MEILNIPAIVSTLNDRKTFTFYSTDTEPIFGYQGKRHVKIYRPFSDVRFLYGGNLPENYCFGLEQLSAKGDTLFVTGGEKDVMTLADLGVKRLVLPLAGTKQEKDVSDYFKLGNTRDNFIQLFIEFLDILYSETMAILKPCEIDFKNPPMQAEMIVSINDVPIGTQGNLLGVTGGEGTGKSNYVGSLIAGTVRNASFPVDTLGTNVLPNTTEKAVLLYDTEQSETQLYKNISGILKRAKLNVMPDCFKAYCLTSMSRKERMQAIVQSMDKFYYQFGGIQMVVIDGIADLVRCANDEAESIAVIDELYRLAGIYKTCIICVLHFIPNGMKLRGHLGSELQRKAAAILSIERDENPQISVVKALKVRDGSPLDVPLIQFSWDKEKMMHTYLGEKPKEEKDKRKETELSGVARTVFSKMKFCTYVELCEQIQSLLDVSERTAKIYHFRLLRKTLKINNNNCSYPILYLTVCFSSL